jgi:predicted membrane protein
MKHSLHEVVIGVWYRHWDVRFLYCKAIECLLADVIGSFVCFYVLRELAEKTGRIAKIRVGNLKLQ